MLLMQACEIVKANNLSDKVVVIHGRVEVRLLFFIIAYYILHYVLATWHFLFFSYLEQVWYLSSLWMLSLSPFSMEQTHC